MKIGSFFLNFLTSTSVRKVTIFLLLQLLINTSITMGDVELLPLLDLRIFRVSFGSTKSAAVLNPAVLGAQFDSRKARQLVPCYNSFSTGYWSDKLALTPYKEFSSIHKKGQWQRLITHLINNSFDVTGNTAEQTSKKISDQIKGGLSIYGGSDLMLLGMTQGNVAIDVRTLADFQTDLPDAPFLILFSTEDGLRRGTDLSLTHMGAKFQMSTDINFAYGQPFNFSGFADFKNASWGLGVTASLGHGYLDLKTIDGGIQLNEEGTEMVLDATMNLKTSGTGLTNKYEFESPFKAGSRIVGYGAGINAGLLMYGEHASIGIALQRLGLMMWKNVQEADIRIHTRTLSAAKLFESELSDDDFDLFDRTEGGYFPNPEKGDSLSKGKNLLCWQPSRVNIGFCYHFDFHKNRSNKINTFSKYINTTFEYEQSLVSWPGRSFLPRIALGAENGFLWGIMPIRIGLVLGGAEKIASSAGFTVNIWSFSLQAGYQAIGTPYLFPKRGMKASLGLSAEWGRLHKSAKKDFSDKTEKSSNTSEVKRKNT